ncbi:TnpA transposase [Shigella sonnei]|nr:TnpA transposase [Shigella sonnei]
MSCWPGCGGAAESRRGEVASILRETEQKTAIHTLNQSEPSSLIVGSVHMSKSGVEETSVLWCFFNLFGVLIPIDERPSGLTQAIIEVGRINKTLYLLNYIDDEDYRRRILTQLNRGESRHAVARAICHGQKGEIRKRYTDGQEDQLGALGLVTNAVVLWNTIYMQAALDHLRAQGETLNDEDIARLSPLCHGHINMLGHYSFTLAELVTKGHLRPLKEASEAENVA